MTESHARPTIGWAPIGAGVALLIVAAFFARPAKQTPTQPQASASDVRAAFEEFKEAWQKEDLEAAVSFFTEDAVVFDPVPPGRFEGGEAIRGWTSGSFKALDQIHIGTSKIRTEASGPIAWVTAHYVFDALLEGKPAQFEGDMTTVWVLQDDGSCKMSVFHASHLPAVTGT
jgi:ketosteroid isomerase-like protein